MKKLISLFFSVSLLFTLAACSGGEKSTQAVGKKAYTFQTFQMEVPEDWRKVSKENFGNTIPQDAMVIFLKKTEGVDFIQNANVVKESLNTDASSLEYAKANMLLGSIAIVDYRPVSSNEVDVGGVKTVFHVFSARNAAAEPLLRYMQTYFAQDRVGYTLTCISQPDDAVQEQTCENAVKSFRFVK